MAYNITGNVEVSALAREDCDFAGNPYRLPMENYFRALNQQHAVRDLRRAPQEITPLDPRFDWPHGRYGWPVLKGSA